MVMAHLDWGNLATTHLLRLPNLRRGIGLAFLKEITPALLCTFKQLPPSAVIKVPHYSRDLTFVKDDIRECMEMCYEYPPCVYVISYKNGPCTVNPSEGETIRVDEVTEEYGNHGVVYQLDRNATDMACPMVEEWLEQSH
ncbi:hypothetical protein TELCIR_06399 [Teladorsagia circumcincta]|uniref:Uncharacterized protein n=1 Tax=Teladorsagia circumcincta TaxID=45464 RepID=A0A2G9UNG0_TELCI|nr:hypothetical protein TELCIR_06399 [Teladorsagia circumcincta]